ncbi:DUF3311 domain-containing protein [Halostagnicola sp. A-GB9-2]|uniref:DUF3311 domain-containing protein n=1 Tax=Halostagnicola sp. A-GB9-2 TaxID=3048066 RepID=UPI0024BF120E|nr:DUF3311 domain-containing protein [Halostagnicola sp. A-GB9-2]MDJ1432538.1 DUF3311 domain-containing protein [Halostagnicola sp. A-GB9-2]
MSRAEFVGWGIVGLVLCMFAIPWFLWGTETLVAGLPLWIWWHVGWMLLASLVFWVFTKRAWGIGIETDAGGIQTANGTESGLEERGDSP